MRSGPGHQLTDCQGSKFVHLQPVRQTLGVRAIGQLDEPSLTSIRTPRLLDLPVRSGRGGVEAGKLHAMIHVIVGRVEVPVKTPLVYGSKDAVFTQIDTGPFLFGTTVVKAASS